jgi:EAL domain-containing protein (putative c-di-GMP-specific phosphodiesterase class I)
LLDKTGVNPKHVELEITESLIMENADQSIAIMKRLKEMGFALAIDDFGTGYSSLSYLKKFPIDSLKIDQAFVRNLEHDTDDKNIVAAIIDLAQHLNLKTIAEGVETEGQWQLLKEMKCDYIQGYYFSKPNRAEHLFT